MTIVKNVVKRDGKIVPFDVDKIKRVVNLSIAETNENIAQEKYESMIDDICKNISQDTNVEDIQNVISKKMMKYGLFDTAEKFILYRAERNRNRINENYGLLSKDFLSKYKHSPSPMTQLGDLVYYRTYSRWLPQSKRREYWWETVKRAVEYNSSLLHTTKEESEELFDNIFNLKQFLSGRTFWVGGTPVTENYPMANYNCSFQIINSFSAFKDLFYLLMVGSGVGLRILKDDVAQLPKIRTDFTVINKEYSQLPSSEREDSTSLEFFYNNTVKITIGDSKEGWVQSLDFFFSILHSNEYRNVKTIIIDYDNVRPKGTPLKTFGGTASGFESLMNMFIKIEKIIKNANKQQTDRIKLKPVDCLDICNIIGENVVVGGVRRTAEIALVDANDQECIEAKSSLYSLDNGKWTINNDLIHRQMSNNSIYYKEKPTRERLKWQLERMRYSGEPAWVNEVAGAKRRPNMNGVNPCGEILLDNKGLCNLTTVNVFAFVDENGVLDRKGLLKAQRLSARSGYRMTCIELELPVWNNTQSRDKLVGCSLTGWQDMVNATKMDKTQEAELMRELREVAHQAIKEIAKANNMEESLLITTVKPEGTLSQLPTVSSGVHYSHSPYYIRRVRINAHDPLVKVCEDLGYSIKPEVGQDIETCSTKVIEFPVQSPSGKTKYDVTAIEQLENYKMFMENYVDHNCSITVSVKPHEWEEVEEWIWDNWDDVVAVSFLPLEDSFYQLMPYEEITKDEYIKMLEPIRNKKITPNKISKYEIIQEDLDIGSESCDTGACPVR